MTLEVRDTRQIDAGHYVSEDGGPRLMRSVIPVRNTHGRAIHPTEKPAALLEILIRTSCPEGGLVGDWFAGSAFSAADVQMSYPLEAAATRAGLGDRFPKLHGFLDRIHARPAYKRAVERGGALALLK